MKNYQLQVTKNGLSLLKIFGVVLLLGWMVFSANAQSINQSSPTPIVSNEVNGRIAARDLGDARLTTYFYTFEGRQGDVFINVVTTNFNGDIDVFTADNLRPLTKVTAYADASNNETGRVIYLRQPLKLILRIEGRTPNDDAATFQVKFAGSFAPSTAVAELSNAPEVKSNNETDVRVNSVGTIIEIKPKPTPKPLETVARVEQKPITPKPVAEDNQKVEKSAVKTVLEQTIIEQTDAQVTAVKETIAETETQEPLVKEPIAENAAKVEEKSAEFPPAVVADDKTIEKETAEKSESESNKATEKPSVEEKTEERTENDRNAETAENKVKESKKNPNTVKSDPLSALASINLIVIFKDGSKVERSMSEILKVGVDKGVLTIVSKNGATGRYSIFDVEKMTIQ